MYRRSAWLRFLAASAVLWLAGCGQMESAADMDTEPLRCGPHVCDPQTEFCSIQDWSPDSRATYSCLPLPEGCRSMTDPDCSCIPILLDCPCEEVREDIFVRRCSRNGAERPD
jgi:hypothetical protein